MKRLRVLESIGTGIATGALLLGMAAATPAAAEPVAVISTDFEDGTLGPWQQSGGPALTVVDVDGGKALQVANRAADFDGIQTPPGAFADLEPGTYTFSMRAKLADGTAGSTGVRFVMKPAYTWIGNTTMTADAWTTVTGTLPITAETDTSALQVYIGTGNLDPVAPYTYLIDDLVITGGTSGGGGEPDPDFVPGGAVNPTATPVVAAQGTGNVSALTFDDGPNGATTAAILDFLAENDIKAVFCVIGQNIEAPGGADLLKRMVAEGHVLCNHTTGYADMGSWTPEQIEADLKENLEIIRTAVGDPNAKVPFFRAPNGSWGQTREVAVELGMQPLAVTNTISDWETQDVDTLTANLRTAMKPGELVLVHDGGGDREGTRQAVQTVVTERLADGWTFTLPVGTPAQTGSESTLSTDFEDGLDGWAPRADASGAAIVEVTTTEAHGGAQSAIVRDRVSEGQGIGHDVTGILLPGTSYEVSAWIKFPAGQTSGNVWLSLANTVGGTTTYSTLGQFTGMSNSEWVQVKQTFQMPAGDSALLYFETAYQGGNTSDFLIDDIVVRQPEPGQVQDLEPIKDTVDFPVGVAIDSRETTGAAAELLLRHFNQVTSENYMKPEAWYNAEGVFTPHPEADTLMEFAAENDLGVYGHVLVWHGQTPAWFFDHEDGTDLTTSEADQQLLRDRMREHIFNVAEHLATTYGEFGSETNPLYAFDVVNEVVNDGAEFEDGLRRSEWYRILGEQFIDLAFEYADEAFNDVYAAEGSDRPVTLFINDYNTEQGGKQGRYLALVERLLERGVPIDGVGHQFHLSLATPVDSLGAALDAFDDLGLIQAVTELDVTTGTPVTEAKLIEQGYFYRDAFRQFRERSDDLFCVTVWGLTDGRSWRASSGAPLVFNDALQAKPAYYGIVDGELPAPLRTANVFQGSPELDADALAWRQLPLQRIAEGSAFQLRWEPDHLTAYVTVTDDSVDASDGVEFEWQGETLSFSRDGSSEDAVVTETTDGYALVARLPLDPAVALGDTVQFDVRVTDGDSTVGWNSPDVLGTLTLVEPLSYTEVPLASVDPSIDGTVDEVWASAGDGVSTDKQVEGESGATAQVRTLWSDNLLYVLAEVADPIVDVSGSDPWIQDSVELYVDAGNYKNGSYRYDDTQIRISADNVVSFGTGDEAFQDARVESAVTRVDGGYVVEASISLLEEGGLGTFHGVDFQVNDASNGARTSIRNWADPTGAGYQSTARWGVAQLVAGDSSPTITLSDSVVEPGQTIEVALSGFTPGDEVELVLTDEGVVAAARAATPAAASVVGSVVIDETGAGTATMTIPADATAGSYRLVATVDGVAVAEAALEVVLPGAGGGPGNGGGGDGLVVTGVEVAGIVLLALLLLAAGAVFVVRRKGASAQ